MNLMAMLALVGLILFIVLLPFASTFILEHNLRKCVCGKMITTKISCSGVDYSHKEMMHFYEKGHCKKCGAEYDEHYTDATSNHAGPYSYWRRGS